LPNHRSISCTLAKFFLAAIRTHFPCPKSCMYICRTHARANKTCQRKNCTSV
jgi:hypothetical protein